MAADTIGIPRSSGDRDIDGLMSGGKWDRLQLVYGFPAAMADYAYFEPVGRYRPFTAAEAEAVEALLGQVAGYTLLEFTRASESGGGDLRFGSGDTHFAGYAYYPGLGAGGDVWISDHHMDTGELEPGNALHSTVMHEIGHALGLKHGHEDPGLTPAHDTHEYSVMTYRSWSGAPDSPFLGGSEENGGWPQTFMMCDIAALQYLYGANFAHNQGDSTYRWDPATGQMSIDGAGQIAPNINRIFMTLWDGGGSDTYDLSNYGNGVRIDLRPGGWTTTARDQLVDLNEQGWDVPPTYARGNIANALLYQGDTRSLIENAIGGDGRDRITGNQAANRLAGGGGGDRIEGGAGDDRLDGGLGDDRLVGGDGSDTADYGSAAAAVTIDLGLDGPQDTAAAGLDSLDVENVAGSRFADLLVGDDEEVNRLGGGGGDDRLDGAGGDDILDGGLGDDLLLGGQGADLASYASAAAAVAVGLNPAPQDTGGAGRDTLRSIAGLIGSRFADTLTGNASANFLDGGAGADTLAGGAGNDVYGVDRAGDTLVEAAGGGIDTVRSSASYRLGAELENLALSGGATLGAGNALANRIAGNDAANRLAGGAGDDRLSAGAGADRLDGGSGADSMAGGAGDDVYVIDHGGDRASEAGGAGSDTIRSSLTHRLGAGFESLILTGRAAADGAGNALANSLTGNNAGNRLDGGGGDDRLDGGRGEDVLDGGEGSDTASYASAAAAVAVDLSLISAQQTGGAGRDTLVAIENLAGSRFADSLTGDGGGNLIDGGAGADAMAGGGGDDLYIVDHDADAAVEAAGGGADTVRSSVSYGIGAEIETLVLTGADAIDGAGNALANMLAGNSAANRLRGGGGNDRLDGGAGADTMAGGAGNDRFEVDEAGDRVVEASGGGIDSVRSSVDHVLGAEVERLVLTGTRDLGGIGNALANRIAGNAAANALSGRGGGDTLLGGGGGDTLAGGGGGDFLAGGEHGDLLDGGGGGDVLLGGSGVDLLTGGDGADRFRFEEGDTGFGLFLADRITDFASGIDRIDLSALDADRGTAGDQAFAFIADAAFSGVAGELRYQSHDGAGIAIGGELWLEGDTDGDGAADFHILLNPDAVLAAADFLL
ncbi:MAG TPA: M10 family metallopeptidase C-terminal domain-containing protein [Allosphingosinicella sp.]|nr:M10 family metallopeptidase C-terminal domain-containing protein [Allosphingosinicella sp.]